MQHSALNLSWVLMFLLVETFKNSNKMNIIVMY